MKTLDKNQLEAIQAMTDHIIAECSVVDTDLMYDEMLDECYSFDKVGGIFSCMCPSRVLKECDPVAYRCGKNDWLDEERENLVEIGDGYFQAEEVENVKEEFIDQLREELHSLREQLSEANAELADLELGDPDNETGQKLIANDIERIEADIERKESDIDACENHSF